jgi:hypothetical protein
MGEKIDKESVPSAKARENIAKRFFFRMASPKNNISANKMAINSTPPRVMHGKMVKMMTNGHCK